LPFDSVGSPTFLQLALVPGLGFEILQLLVVMQILAKAGRYDMIVGMSRGVVDASVVADAEQADDSEEEGHDYDEAGKILYRTRQT